MNLPAWLRRLARPAALVIVALLLAAAYGGAWVVRGRAPFVGTDACAPSEASPAASGSAAASPTGSPDAAGDGLTLDFAHHPDPLQPGTRVSWSFTVRNTTDAVIELTLRSGQNGDVVLRRDGVGRYRWSEGRFFTQQIRTVELSPHGSWSFTLEDTLDIEPGTYDLVATVASEPAPAPATRTVTVGSAASPSPSPSPSSAAGESSSPSATPSPVASPSPTPTQSSTGSPSPTGSPMAAAAAGAPPAVALVAARAHRRRGRLRHVALFVAALLAVAWFSPSPARAQEGSGGSNIVLAVNQTDGRTASRSGVMVGRAAGPSVVPDNVASASASCTDCRTVAVALQTVFVIDSPQVAAPRNAAVAVNGGCTRCETFAYAWQYVFTTGGPVTLSTEGQGAVAEIRADAQRLAASDLPLPDLARSLDDVAQRFRQAMDREVRLVGGTGVSDRAVDLDATTC